MQNMTVFKDENRMSWNVVKGVTFQNCPLIFPTQQKDVQNLLDGWKDDSNIVKVIIFGSSVTSACNPWSDIDVYVEVKKPVERFSKPGCVVPFDIWTNYDVDDRLLEEINRTGVIVYE